VHVQTERPEIAQLAIDMMTRCAYNITFEYIEHVQLYASRMATHDVSESDSKKYAEGSCSTINEGVTSRVIFASYSPLSEGWYVRIIDKSSSMCGGEGG
jgi:hypothetical protein